MMRLFVTWFPGRLLDLESMPVLAAGGAGYLRASKTFLNSDVGATRTGAAGRGLQTFPGERLSIRIGEGATRPPHTWSYANPSSLADKKVAILVADGFEQVELTGPKKALDDAGARTSIVSPAQGTVQGWKHFDHADRFAVDVRLDQARAEDFDALLLPGGVANPDQLRANPRAVAFVRAFFDAGKPVAAICHGPWTLIEADAVRGRTVTSWPSLKTDLRNAGGNWVDREVVVDDGVVTSRKPDDIPAFNREMIELFAQAETREAAASSR